MAAETDPEVNVSTMIEEAVDIELTEAAAAPALRLVLTEESKIHAEAAQKPDLSEPERVPLQPVPREVSQEFLFQRLRQGDQQAEAVLVDKHMPLAISLARKYCKIQGSLEDAEQVASLGLVKAI